MGSKKLPMWTTRKWQEEHLPRRPDSEERRREDAACNLRESIKAYKSYFQTERIQNALEYEARGEEAYPYLGGDAITYAETLNHVFDFPEILTANTHENYKTRKLRLAVGVLMDLVEAKHGKTEDEEKIRIFRLLLERLTAAPRETH